MQEAEGQRRRQAVLVHWQPGRRALLSLGSASSLQLTLCVLVELHKVSPLGRRPMEFFPGDPMFLVVLSSLSSTTPISSASRKSKRMSTVPTTNYKGWSSTLSSVLNLDQKVLSCLC